MNVLQVAKSIQMAMGLHDDDVAFFLAADEPATYLQVGFSSGNIAMYLERAAFCSCIAFTIVACMRLLVLSRSPWPGSTVLSRFQLGLKCSPKHSQLEAVCTVLTIVFISHLPCRACSPSTWGLAGSHRLKLCPQKGVILQINGR